MKKILLLTVPIFIVGCQSAFSNKSSQSKTKQTQEYTHVACAVKKQKVGSFHEKIVFDKDFKTMTIADRVVDCTSDEFTKCKAKVNTEDGYIFYSVSVYTYKYPGSGFLDAVEIKNNMLTDASHAELECNHL